MGRSFDDYPYMLVALLISLDVLDTLGLHTKDFARLGPSRDFHFYLAVQSRHIDLGTQRRLNETYRNVAKNIQGVTHKDRMGFHLDDHIKVSWDTPAKFTFAFISQFEARSGVHTSGDLNTEGVQLSYPSRATTGGTWIFDDRAMAVTLVTSSRDAKKALLETYLSSAATRGTGLRRRSGFSAVAVAVFACTLSRYFYLLFGSGDGFLKSEG